MCCLALTWLRQLIRCLGLESREVWSTLAHSTLFRGVVAWSCWLCAPPTPSLDVFCCVDYVYDWGGGLGYLARFKSGEAELAGLPPVAWGPPYTVLKMELSALMLSLGTCTSFKPSDGKGITAVEVAQVRPVDLPSCSDPLAGRLG